MVEIVGFYNNLYPLNAHAVHRTWTGAKGSWILLRRLYNYTVVKYKKATLFEETKGYF